MRVAGRILVPLIIGVAGAVVLMLLGLQVEFAWGWGVLVAALTALFGLRMPDDPRVDAPGRRGEKTYVGSDVSRLAWAINLGGDTVSEAVTRRVRATLRRRLAHHGIDPDDAAHRVAAERLLGSGLWERLNGRRTGIQDIRDALAAAERLSTTEPADTTRRERTP